MYWVSCLHRHQPRALKSGIGQTPQTSALLQQRDVSFSVDHEAYATVIKVFKSETGELIKQFPPEEILAMIARMRKNIGWLVDSKA